MLGDVVSETRRGKHVLLSPLCQRSQLENKLYSICFPYKEPTAYIRFPLIQRQEAVTQHSFCLWWSCRADSGLTVSLTPALLQLAHVLIDVMTALDWEGLNEGVAEQQLRFFWCPEIPDADRRTRRRSKLWVTPGCWCVSVFKDIWYYRMPQLKVSNKKN